MSLADLLGAVQDSDGAMRFELGPELHGAFGGAFGGAVAACAVMTVRSIAIDRVPTGLDVRFLRGLPAGTVTAAAEVLHAGRSVTVVDVDLAGADGRRAARATVSLAQRDTLFPLEHLGEPAGELDSTYDEAKPWAAPPGREIPILETLAPRILGRAGDGIATALRLPWEPDESSAAEACCFAADLCVGPPVAAACTSGWVPHPNPDLSLRVAAGATVERDIVGVGTAARIARGVAAVRIDVRCGAAVVAVGAATSLLLATEGTPK